MTITFTCPNCEKENPIRIKEEWIEYGEVDESELECQYCSQELILTYKVSVEFEVVEKDA